MKQNLELSKIKEDPRGTRTAAEEALMELREKCWEAKSQISNIPEELRSLPQWVNFRLELNGEPPYKPKKVPFNSQTGYWASSTDPKSWSDFEMAVSRLGKYDGIGFVMTDEDPYTGIDFDAVRDFKTQEIEKWVLEMVDRFGSYAEISPSGTGVHIIVRGTLPPEGRNRIPNIEVYDRNRYFTFTGNILKGYNQIRDSNPLRATIVHHSMKPLLSGLCAG